MTAHLLIFLILAIVVLVLFGRGRISSLMGDVARGITSFRQGLKEGTEEAGAEEDGKTIEGEAVSKQEEQQ